MTDGSDPLESRSREDGANTAEVGGAGIRLPDLGSVTEATDSADRTGKAGSEPGGDPRTGMAERRGSPAGSPADDTRTDQFSRTVNSSLEVVGFTWSAPLPTPQDLEAYESVVPGSAIRILAMAELTISGPMENAAKLTTAEIEASKLGLSYAIKLTSAMTLAAVISFALGIVGIGSTVACLTAGSVYLSVPVVMLVRSFIARS